MKKIISEVVTYNNLFKCKIYLKYKESVDELLISNGYEEYIGK